MRIGLIVIQTYKKGITTIIDSAVETVERPIDPTAQSGRVHVWVSMWANMAFNRDAGTINLNIYQS